MTADDDVAAAFARFYDLDLDEDPGDLDLYRALARRTGGPILELGVGTGRLAVALAADGYDVTGVDSDPAMLARADVRAQAAGPAVAGRLTLVEGDMAAMRLSAGDRYRLAFIALNSLMLLGTRERQAAAVATLAAHLAPGGMAVVDVWLPDAEDLVRFDGRLSLEYARPAPDADTLVCKSASARHDAATGTVELTVIYEEGQAGAAAARYVRTDRLRLVTSAELATMAEAAGLVVEALAGDHDLGPLGPGASRAVLVATHPRSEGGTPVG
jgi:SAM-dependent methyltransferase